MKKKKLLKKKQLLKKRILALAVSALMAFTSTDHCVALAGQMESQETASESVPETTVETAATHGSTEEAAGTAAEPNASDDAAAEANTTETAAQTDAASDPAGETETTAESDTAESEESGEAGVSVPAAEETKTEETETDETQPSTEEEETALTEESETEEALTGDEALLSEDDEVEKGLKYSGKVNDITWKIYKDGRCVISGTGDYLRSSQSEPDWAESDTVAYSIKTVEVNITGITTTRNMFVGCRSLVSADLSHLDTSNVKDMSEMFVGCESLTSLDLSSFNTSRVTNMERMFQGCENLTKLDISSFDTSNVTNMLWMFENCKSLTELDLRNFNTGKAKHLELMFERCSGLTSLNVSSFDTSKSPYLCRMFNGCSSLTSLDVSNFDTGNVTDLSCMFNGCSSLTSLDISNFDTGKVESMSFMFGGCSSLTSLDLSNFNTSNAEDMGYMFQNCRSLVSLDLSGFDTRKVWRTDNMFDGCRNLVSLNVSSFDIGSIGNPDELGDVWGMRWMFQDCHSLASLDLSSFDMGKLTADKMKKFLNKCNSLSYIRTPKNCPENVALSGNWYAEDGTLYQNTLPAGVASSIDLYKDGYPGDGMGTTKKAVFISGITMRDKIYDGSPSQYTGTAVVTDSSGNMISDVSTSYSYTGTLTDGSVYVETTEAPSQAGNYILSLAVTENDTYTGQQFYSFCIRQRPVTITAPSVVVQKDEQLPILSELACTIDGLLEGDTLTAEPKLKYEPETVSTAITSRYSIVPYGAEAGKNYSIKYINGVLTVENPDDDSAFEDADRLDLDSAGGMIVSIKAKTYDGVPYEPTVKVTVLEGGKKKTLTEGADYRVLYENNVNAGTGKVIVRGNGTYKGELDGTFTINPKPIKTLKIIAGSMAVGDTASGLPVYIYDGAIRLREEIDYTLSDIANLTEKEAKSVKITINGTGNYKGSATAGIAVYDTDASKIINQGTVYLEGKSSDESYVADYTGKAVKPAVTVKIGETILTNNNYKVSYQNNTNAGTAYVIVTGKGEYKGKVVTAFEIKSDTQTLTIDDIKAKTYNGKLQKPSVKVKAGTKTLKKNKDYTVTYKNNLHAGTATVTVTGTGNYSGTKTQTFTIAPQKISKVSVKGTRTEGLQITCNKRLLKEGHDYTLEYDETSLKNNKIKVTIKAVEGGDFTDSVVKTVKI